MLSRKLILDQVVEDFLLDKYRLRVLRFFSYRYMGLFNDIFGNIGTVNVDKSKTETNVLNLVTTKQRSDIQNRCATGMKGSNVASWVAKGEGSSIVAKMTISQESAIRNSCEFKAVVHGMVSGDIDAAIAVDVAKSQGGDSVFGLNISNTENLSTIENVVRNEELISMLNEAIADIDVSNTVELIAEGGGTINVEAEITQANVAFNEAMTESISEFMIDNGIAVDTVSKTALDQVGATESKGVIFWVGIIIAIVAAILVVMKLRARSKTSPISPSEPIGGYFDTSFL